MGLSYHTWGWPARTIVRNFRSETFKRCRNFSMSRMASFRAMIFCIVLEGGWSRIVTFPKNLPRRPCSLSPFNNNMPAAKIIKAVGNIYDSKFLQKIDVKVVKLFVSLLCYQLNNCNTIKRAWGSIKQLVQKLISYVSRNNSGLNEDFCAWRMYNYWDLRYFS